MNCHITALLMCQVAISAAALNICTPPCSDDERCVSGTLQCQDGMCPKHNICVSTHDESIHVQSRESVYPLTRAGSCPVVRNASPGPCVEQCRVDADCRSGRKCCSNGCGHTCQRATRETPSHRPGSCPWYARESDSCEQECLSDHECRGRRKCCVTSCGTVCVQPCFHWLTNVHVSNFNRWRLSRRCARPRQSY